ncbi:MAG TPA: hydroxymethylglutaryl-CoA reductase (NADPH) [Thermoanaerobaculia bacterium]|nr:hydroxymethylglutaryl-CoA reductase (NADPH) [Thermoanaerobaculia bacterium]
MSQIKPVDPAPPARHSREELVRSLVSGERRFHELPRDLPAAEAAEVRRQALEEMTQSKLENIGHHSLDVGRASYRHCENFIGVAQVPMGVVGPLRVRGERTDEEVYVPLATTEAALVASTNRGCAALRAAGGVVVRVEDVGMTRAPVFRTSGVVQTQQFVRWIREHEEELRRVAEATSRYLKLLDVRPFAFGTTVFLRFRFDAGDAMGMNMATIACDRMVSDLIEPQTGVPCIALSGNYCTDKKPAGINFQEGRGKRIYAEALLDGEVLHSYLKTDSRSLVEAQYRKNLLGSVAAGSLGYNAHFANVLAAFFIATGQDAAHVVEGSLGVTCIEPRGPEGVFASIFLPDVPLGAIGGGTALDTQREALAILGVAPDPQRRGGAVIRLAEILGAVVLAGEISLMAAFTSQDLARAHERLGRGAGATDMPLLPT